MAKYFTLLLFQDLVMDILRVLSTPDLEVRKKTLQLALDLVSSRNVEEVNYMYFWFIILFSFFWKIPVFKKFDLFCSLWLFWRRRWLKLIMWRSMKILTSIDSFWFGHCIPVVFASQTWLQMLFQWYADISLFCH